MKTVKEIKEFIDNVPCGEAIYKISWSHSDLLLSLDDWKYKENLRNRGNWLERCLASDLIRKYDKTLNKMVVLDKERVFRNSLRYIKSAIIDAAHDTSPAGQPKRTNAYKGIVDMAYTHEADENFVNDILPILNYHFSSKTDSNESMNMKVHKTNTFALLEILRKKYGSK